MKTDVEIEVEEIIVYLRKKMDNEGNCSIDSIMNAVEGICRGNHKPLPDPVHIPVHVSVKGMSLCGSTEGLSAHLAYVEAGRSDTTCEVCRDLMHRIHRAQAAVKEGRLDHLDVIVRKVWAERTLEERRDASDAVLDHKRVILAMDCALISDDCIAEVLEGLEFKTDSGVRYTPAIVNAMVAKWDKEK